jgi:hypothetical protein
MAGLLDLFNPQQPGQQQGGGLFGMLGLPGIGGGLQRMAPGYGDQQFERAMQLRRMQLQERMLEEKPQFQKVTDPTTGADILLQTSGSSGPKQVWPMQGGAPSQVPQPGQPAIPAPPPGVNAKEWRDTLTKKTAEDAAAEIELRKGGDMVLKMTDHLEQMIHDPKTKKPNPAFDRSAGPFKSEAADMSSFDPRRMVYEVSQNREDKAYLDRIKSTAQGIHSVMERNLLKGGGQITEAERAQVRKILSDIAGARSSQDALTQLNNYRDVVRNMFRLGPSQQPQQAAPSETFKEGQTATNSQTGQRAVYRGGQWVPMQ